MSNHKDFVFVGGALSVDFSNTIKIIDGSKTDLLYSPLSLYRWTQLLQLDIPFETIEKHFQEFKTIRNLIHECFQDFAYNRIVSADHIRKFNEFIQNLKVHPYIIPGNPAYPSLSLASDKIHSTFIHHVLKSFLDVITEEETLKRLKPCENHECVLLFVDHSKNQTRRWCNMATCGNKAKASRFYYRNQRE